MKITKIGHSCLIVETKGRRIVTDPGSYTKDENEKLKNIDVVLITHEHEDHFHLGSIKKIVENNPETKLITNEGAGKFLKEESIPYLILEDGVPTEISGVVIEAHRSKHEEIFEEYGQVENTAYLIDELLLHVGDSFYVPTKQVEILALPVGGPWNKVKDFMKYALEVNPKICFPVHDGMLNNFGSSHKVPELFLSKAGIVFKNFEENKTEEF
jgi:L-ascorbate metabolism protein UlaG (beta-lactamase superfamily)